MSRRLPDQQDTTGTYMELPVVDWLFKTRLVPGQPEGETSRMWNTILTQFFKAEDGYTTGPEMLLGRGKADLFTAHLVFDTRHNEKKFLVVECKAPGLESQRHVLDEEELQLERYLKAINGTHRKFGAIAIGRIVRFYELKDGQLVALLDDSMEYNIGRQCQDVTSRLQYFRDNHHSR